MNKRDRQERELKENTTNFAVLKNWWKLIQSVESIRNNSDDRVAILARRSTSVSHPSQP